MPICLIILDVSMKKRAEKVKTWSKDFWKELKFFIKNVLLLFSQDFWEVMAFIFGCAIMTMLFTQILKNAFINLILIANGEVYISPDNVISVFTSEISIFLIMLFLILVTFMSLFEIAGLLHTFSMAKIGRETNISSMVIAGLRTCKKALRPRNWLIVPFIVVLLPITEVLSLSSASFKAAIPGFIRQSIESNSDYSLIFRIVYIALLLFEVTYIFSINFFVLKDDDYNKSLHQSRKMQKGNYLKTCLCMLTLTLVLNFFINAVSSTLVTNIRDAISLFEKNTGIITKSSQIGSYVYIIKQILNATIAPAINNAGLTVLFYRYIEKNQSFSMLNPKIFQRIPFSKKRAAIALALFLLIVGPYTYYLSTKYAFLKDPVERPLVCAHRGDNVHAPENTMPAFELAATANLPWIELDVHQTIDDVIVVSHDDDLNRVTGTSITIHDNTYEELQNYYMGDWMPGNFKKVTIPTLKEALLLAKENNMKVQVEIKPTPYDRNIEEKILDVINETGMHDNVMIICLKDAPLKRIKQLDPDITVAYCMFIAWSDVEKIDFTDNVSIEEGNITPDLVQKLHKEGKKVFCWTVDEEDTIQYLVSCGVDVIGTDNPMMVVNALDKVEYSGGLTRCFNIIMNSIANMGR